jgi:acetyl-CoA carboxylase biotin carboxyl carrier protein
MIVTKDLDEELVRRLANLLDETGLGEIEYAIDTLRIRVARPTVGAPAAQFAAPMAAPAPSAGHSAGMAAPSGSTAPEETGEIVASPMVGTVYVAAEPGAAPLAQVGAPVRKGQTVMIVEAMKTMNPIPAPRDGVVKSVRVENGQPVEYGQALLVLE